MQRSATLLFGSVIFVAFLCGSFTLYASDQRTTDALVDTPEGLKLVDAPLSTAQSASGGKPDEHAWTARDIAYLLSPLISLFGVGLIVIYNQKTARADQWLKINEAEADYIQAKLDKFYGPFMLESDANHLMAQDLRSRQPDPDSYRLLDKLFDGQWRENLSPGDAALVAEICQTGERLARIIKEHCGLADAKILPYISRAITHFRVLKLAYEKKLGADSKPYLRYVYPKALDPVLRKELNRLQERLTLLRQNPTKPHGELAPLDLTAHPLDSWPDPQRPDYDPKTDSLRPGTGPGKSLLGSQSLKEDAGLSNERAEKSGRP